MRLTKGTIQDARQRAQMGPIACGLHIRRQRGTDAGGASGAHQPVEPVLDNQRRDQRDLDHLVPQGLWSLAPQPHAAAAATAITLLGRLPGLSLESSVEELRELRPIRSLLLSLTNSVARAVSWARSYSFSSSRTRFSALATTGHENSPRQKCQHVVYASDTNYTRDATGTQAIVNCSPEPKLAICCHGP